MFSTNVSKDRVEFLSMIEVPLYIMNLYHLSMNNQGVYDNIVTDLFSLMIPVYASYLCSILDE